MPFIASKYAALIFDVKIVTLQNAAMRNSTRYTYTKFQNKLLFKVTNSQLCIALNKGLIDANIEVYNDDLTLIQDFFKTNSIRRTNGKANSNKKGVVDGCNSNTFTSSSNIVLGCGVVGEFKHKDILTNNKGAVDVECIEYCSFSVSSDSVYGQHKAKANVISNVGGSATLTRADKTSISHTKGKTKSYGQTEQNDTKFNANHTQGVVDDTQSKTSAKAIKRDRSDNEDFGENRTLQLTNGTKDKTKPYTNNRRQAKRVEKCAGDEKRLLAHSSSKSSSTTLDNQGGGGITKILKGCDMGSNHTLLKAFLKDKESGDNSLLSEANEKALLLDKIEQRVANNESIKSICNELSISRQQYYRMSKAYKEQGLAGLVDKRAISDKKSIGASIPDVLKEQAIMIWRACGAGGINYAQMHESLHNYAGIELGYDYQKFLDGKTEELFSVKTLIAFMDEYKRINHLEASIVEKGFDKTKSYKQPAQGNSKKRVSTRNEMWEIDSSPLDCMLQDENGVEFRPHILSVVDVYSGRMVCALGDVSNALSLVRLLWKAIDTMGLPLKIKGDNGKDYLSNHFQGVINRLGITYDFTAPYSGELKPFVERAFKTIQHSVISLLPGYLGHNLATREIIEQRTPKKERKAKNEYGKVKKTNQSHLMDFSQAEQVLDTAVNKWNIISNNRVKNRASRIDTFNSCDNPLIKMTYEYFLARAGELYEKKVQKKGININSRTYISADMPSVGTSIKVVTNIDNISEIYVYDGDFNFICIAKDNTIAELSAEELKANKKAFTKECQAINKVIKDTNISEFTKLTLEHDKKVIKQLHEEKLKDETIILRDDEASKKYKEKGKLLKEVSSCLDYTAPKIQTINDEDEMSYEDLIKNSKIG